MQHMIRQEPVYLHIYPYHSCTVGALLSQPVTNSLLAVAWAAARCDEHPLVPGQRHAVLHAVLVPLCVVFVDSVLRAGLQVASAVSTCQGPAWRWVLSARSAAPVSSLDRTVQQKAPGACASRS